MRSPKSGVLHSGPPGVRSLESFKWRTPKDSGLRLYNSENPKKKLNNPPVTTGGTSHTQEEIMQMNPFSAIERFPEITRDALRVALCVPVSQVSVERLFSVLKHMTPDHRSRLKSDLIDNMLFLRVNGFYVWEAESKWSFEPLNGFNFFHIYVTFLILHLGTFVWTTRRREWTDSIFFLCAAQVSILHSGTFHWPEKMNIYFNSFGVIL